ncbi:MAG: DUF1330 domain-containing protein [Pseudomonadota bacterium]
MTAAYYVGLILIRDAEKWQEYMRQVGSTITQYGGVVVFRGVKHQDMAGEGIADAIPHSDVVTLQFADIASARRWHDSPEYQRLIRTRDLGADVTLILYAG